MENKDIYKIILLIFLFFLLMPVFKFLIFKLLGIGYFKWGGYGFGRCGCCGWW
jgi:hypothetical protein